MLAPEPQAAVLGAGEAFAVFLLLLGAGRDLVVRVAAAGSG